MLQVAYGLGHVSQAFVVSIPAARLWSPADPFLYNVTVSLISPAQQRAVASRAVSILADGSLVSFPDCK